VANGAYVNVRLGTIEFCFCHCNVSVESSAVKPSKKPGWDDCSPSGCLQKFAVLIVRSTHLISAAEQYSVPLL
jgi:hypothetical protein